MCVSLVETLLASLRLDECTINFHTCDVNAAFQNTAGLCTCSCKAGFTGDEKTCYGKNIMKKMQVQSILALKINFQSGVVMLNLHQTYTFLLDSSYT